MITDITGITLIPGNLGKDCAWNGERNGIECCCEECDYLVCCMGNPDSLDCKDCDSTEYPRCARGSDDDIGLELIKVSSPSSR